MKWQEETSDKDYTDIPDYVIDAVMVDKDYASVK